ncbi:hypothetical protein EJB05_03592 [Eragrostis curvula]|uniref:RIN4 pathogenic type III effector avirulence factor Avr cleavage site domain-containing protein n=1 Tax=Eragrostis curvula TaxID=38414 RepID=A0A5J9SD26_9POAL|nr:hypothetical protein EJB05_57786 [Eragrostis curvula]TVU44157.1 hypothetical protein EJB05_03592 [Eragrostis curvula]
MAQHQGVPKFGSWENEGDHLYTQYFENARKGKSPGRSVSQNDLKGDMEGLSKDPPSAKASPLRTGSDPVTRKPKDERRANREDELRRQEATARKPYAESPNHRYGDNANYENAARKNSAERSPLHPRQQARIVNKGGVSSPSWERRGLSEGNRGAAPTTPGRSKLRSSGHGDETPDRGSAVPKFGEWDEKDPSTGEGFTDIFNKVREEKQSGSAPVSTSDSGYNRSNQNRKYESSVSPLQTCCYAAGFEFFYNETMIVRVVRASVGSRTDIYPVPGNSINL